MRGIEIAMRRGLWLFALTLGVLGACSNKNSNTKIMVAVWTNIAVPSEMDSIHIDAKTSSTSPSFKFSLMSGSGQDAVKFPVVVELVSPDNKSLDFVVAASGYLETSVVVSQTAHLLFDPGHSRVLTLFLDRACLGATSGPCVQTVDINVAGLPEYDPQTPFLAPDASPGMRDATGGGRAETGDVEIVADAGVVADARQDGDATADVAIPDMGPDVSADISGSLDVALDTPAEQAAKGDLGQGDSGPDSPCVNGCTQLGDAAVDNPALDGVVHPVIDAVSDSTASDSPADGFLNRDVSLDSPPDLLPTPDLGRDLMIPDDAAACVLPLTTCAGACINPQTNASHCGGCGQACGTQNGTPSCAAAVCSMSACSAGFLDCSPDENTSRDGCETNATTDPANCGHCGNICSSRVCRNQVCLATARYGNTGPGTAVSSFEGNFLAGIQVYIPNDSVVTGFGAVLYGGTANATLYLGLYKDMAGSPGALVATVPSPTLVAPGGKEMNVDPPMSVTAGTYWILGVWDGLASFASNSATAVTWRYISYPFAALPTTAPTSMTTISLPPPNLFVIVAQ